jgi:hypothetical protein
MSDRIQLEINSGPSPSEPPEYEPYWLYWLVRRHDLGDAQGPYGPCFRIDTDDEYDDDDDREPGDGVLQPEHHGPTALVPEALAAGGSDSLLDERSLPRDGDCSDAPDAATQEETDLLLALLNGDYDHVENIPGEPAHPECPQRESPSKKLRQR